MFQHFQDGNTKLVRLTMHQGKPFYWGRGDKLVVRIQNNQSHFVIFSVTYIKLIMVLVLSPDQFCQSFGSISSFSCILLHLHL